MRYRYCTVRLKVVSLNQVDSFEECHDKIVNLIRIVVTTGVLICNQGGGGACGLAPVRRGAPLASQSTSD